MYLEKLNVEEFRAYMIDSFTLIAPLRLIIFRLSLHAPYGTITSKQQIKYAYVDQ